MPSQAAGVKLQYYQTEDSVVVGLTRKDADLSTAQVLTESKRLRVTVGDEALLDTILYGTIDPEKTKNVAKPRKVEITLFKAEKNHWDKLEDDQQFLKAAKSAPTDKWTSLARQVEEEEEQTDDVNGLFQKIFKNADEDTRRAMIKSFTESKGTVLSTNWNEIGNKKTEVKPPDCMEYIPPAP